MPVRASELRVASEQRGAQSLCQNDVDSIVRSQRVSELPDTGEQIEVSETLNSQLRVVLQTLSGCRRTQLSRGSQPTQSLRNLQVEQVRGGQRFFGRQDSVFDTLAALCPQEQLDDGRRIDHDQR